MQGHAFKCDQCGRVSFAPNGTGNPPFGWYGLSNVTEADSVWPQWHFDTAMCLAEYTDNMVTIPDLRTVTAEPVTDNPGAAEVTISEWTAVDEPAG